MKGGATGGSRYCLKRYRRRKKNINFGQQDMKITNEIFQIAGKDHTFHQDGAGYLINFNGHAAVIDVGTGRAMEKLLANILACGVDLEQIEYLLLSHSHFDHVGGAQGLKAVTPCRTVAHELAARYLEQADNVVTAAYAYKATIRPFLVDWRLSGSRQEIELGGRTVSALHLPGHSPDSMAFFTESDGFKVLFAQDALGPLEPIILSDKEAYQQSLNDMLFLEADILCDGHCGIFRGKEAVREYIKSCLIL